MTDLKEICDALRTEMQHPEWPFHEHLHGPFQTLRVFGELVEPGPVQDWVRWVARVWPFVGTVHQNWDMVRCRREYSWTLSYDDQPDGYNLYGRSPIKHGRAKSLEAARDALEQEAGILWRRASRIFGH